MNSHSNISIGAKSVALISNVKAYEVRHASVVGGTPGALDQVRGIGGFHRVQQLE